MTAPYEIRLDEAGELDEVVADNPEFFHFERMDNCAWWMCLTFADGTEIHINVGAVNQRARPYALAEER